MEPREIVRRIENDASLPAGKGDRFAGYAVIGQPFLSGHVLALRRFPASSVGPGYTSVWHRDPQGIWTFYSTVVPEQGCSRYFGGEVTRNIVTPIDIHWFCAKRFRIAIEGTLKWEVTLTQSPMSRVMNAVASLLPDACWRKKFVLQAMGDAARLTLGTDRMNLIGRTPNGQEFIANPRRIWFIDASRATIRGDDLGPAGPLERQARMNEFLIPQRGLFAVVHAFLEAPDKSANEGDHPIALLERHQIVPLERNFP